MKFTEALKQHLTRTQLTNTNRRASEQGQQAEAEFPRQQTLKGKPKRFYASRMYTHMPTHLRTHTHTHTQPHGALSQTQMRRQQFIFITEPNADNKRA